MTTPEYILSLRERIGHDLLWLPGATAVVLQEGRILLGRRSDNGNWAPITGIVDPGEEPAATAARECEEEAGVVCEVEGLAAVKAGGEVVFPNGDRCRFLDHTFRCRYVSGTARVNDEESTEMAWFDLEDMPSLRPDLLRRVRAALDFDGTTQFSTDPGPSQDPTGAHEPPRS